MRSRKCEWHDVKLLGILGSGKSDVREIELLGTSVRLREEELGCEASGKHRRALLEGFRSIEESKTVNSTAVKPQAIGQEEDGENGEEFGGLVAAGQVGRALRRERDMHEDGEPDTRRREKGQDGVQIPEG